MTLRGTINVALWIGGLMAIAVIGPMIVAVPQPVWAAVGVIAMIVAARWWPYRSARLAPPPER